MGDNQSMKKCPGVIDAAQDTIVMALKLTDKTILRSPQMIKKLVESEEVWKEIEKVMLAEGKRLVKLQQKGKVVTVEEVAKSGQKVASKAGDAATKDLKKQIERSGEYQKVRQSLNQLQCSVKQSPVGVFVDENKGWLILVGVGVALGGATAMYIVRGGDIIASPAASLASKALRFKMLGDVLEVGAKKIKFEPSSRTVETTVFATATWKSVKTSLDLHVAFKDDKLTATSARGEVVVKVAKGLTVQGHGQVGYKRPEEPYHQSLLYDVGLGLSYKPGAPYSGISITTMAFATQDPTTRKIGGKGEANVRIVGGNGPLAPSLSVYARGQGSRNETFMPSGQSQIQSEAVFDLGLNFKF